MNETYDKYLTKIKKNYKNTDFILDMYLENYHERYIYLRIDYYKKLGEYKLSWLDFTDYNNKFESVISYELIPKELVNRLIAIISKIKLVKIDKEITDTYRVTINSGIKTTNKDNFSLTCNRYIPKEYPEMVDVINILFDYLPRRLYPLGEELKALIFGVTSRYEYQEDFSFDLFKDDLSSIMDEDIITRGDKYYKEGRVFFLEKIGDTYYAVVGGTNLYVIKIGYNEKEKLMRVYCNCPCEFYCKHIYAVIKAIRNNKFHSFFKITNQSDDIPLLDIVMDFKFLLCIGIDDGNTNYLVIEDDMIKVLPILEKGKSNWRVLEDDEKETLTKRLKNILK